MIRCSKCGTLNRDNSRFCNDCGAPLQPTKIRCSACGTLNAVGNVFCDKCNARLLSGKDMVPPMATKPEHDEASTPSIKGISLPSRQASPDETVPERAELPDWLLELTDESGGAAPHTPEAPAAANLSDWLSGIAPEDVPSPAAHSATPAPLAPTDLPDWLSELAEEETPSAEPAQPEAATDMPDWLSEIVPPSAPERPEAAEALPDWLSGLEAETEAGESEPESELPDWLSAPEPPAAPASGEKAAAADLPDWLSGLAPEEETAPAEAQPDWLSGIAIEEPTSAEEPSSGWPKEEEETIAPAMADWMSGLAGQESSDEAFTEEAPTFEEQPAGWPEEEAFEAAPEAYASGGVLPAWLSAIADDEAGYSSAGPPELPQWLLQHADPNAPSFESAGPAPLPGWLMAHADTDEPPRRASSSAQQVAPPPARSTPASTKQPQQEAPADWASGLLAEAAEAEGAEEPVDWTTMGATTEAEEENLPDWLSGVDAEAAETAQEPTGAPEIEEAELPDWLRGLDEGAPSAAQKETPAAAPSDWLSGGAEAEESELPDWLQGIKPEEPAPDLAEPTEEPAEAAELPDWLSGLDATEPSGRETRQESAPARDGVPDWLAAIPQESLTTSEPEEEEEELSLGKEVAEPPAMAEIPDWLSNLTPASAEGEGAGLPTDENLARAQVPGWLQELRPSGTGPLPPLPEDAPVSVPDAELSAGEAEGLLRAEIPDWVQKLRPTVTADGEVRPSAAMTEEEGPLAGLPSVIFPKAGIDIPDDFQPQPLPQTPDAIIQQAQLWQQLLEQPRGKAHAVSRSRTRPGWGIIAVRLLSVVVLLLAILAGLLLSGERLSESPPPTARPGVVRLIKAIDALESNDLVILAVEYGPAEAPEMQIMVETLLDHLKERQVKIVAVSSLPEGAGMASSLLLTHAITNELADGETPYLSGTYNGIADFLGDMEGQSPALLLVLSGRAERTCWWIEQNALHADATPLALGVNASTGAVVLPYFDVKGVVGWVVGFADTVTYRDSRGISPEPVGQLFEYGRVLDSLMLAHWAAICMIFFGFLYSLAAGKQETKS